MFSLLSCKQEEINPHQIGCAETTPKDFICLAVEDTGTGMDSNAMDKIFQPYFYNQRER